MVALLKKEGRKEDKQIVSVVPILHFPTHTHMVVWALERETIRKAIDLRWQNGGFLHSSSSSSSSIRIKKALLVSLGHLMLSFEITCLFANGQSNCSFFFTLQEREKDIQL